MSESLVPKQNPKIQSILDAYCSGEFTMAELGLQMGVSKQYVWQVVKKANISIADIRARTQTDVFQDIKVTIHKRLKRLAALIEKDFEQGTNSGGMKMELKYIERLCKMYNIDAPELNINVNLPMPGITFQDTKIVDVEVLDPKDEDENN